jgi:hypothetical protein
MLPQGRLRGGVGDDAAHEEPRGVMQIDGMRIIANATIPAE